MNERQLRRVISIAARVGVVAIAAVLVYFAASAHGWLRPADGMARPDGTMVEVDEHLTLDPALFQGPVKAAYAVARRDPALLAQLHCYCGCDRTNNHKNLLDCFRDMHGSRCQICVGEALDGERLAQQGTPIEQIRDVLRERYAHGD